MGSRASIPEVPRQYHHVNHNSSDDGKGSEHSNRNRLPSPPLPFALTTTCPERGAAPQPAPATTGDTAQAQGSSQQSRGSMHATSRLQPHNKSDREGLKASGSGRGAAAAHMPSDKSTPLVRQALQTDVGPLVLLVPYESPKCGTFGSVSCTAMDEPESSTWSLLGGSSSEGGADLHGRRRSRARPPSQQYHHPAVWSLGVQPPLPGQLLPVTLGDSAHESFIDVAHIRSSTFKSFGGRE